MSKGQLVGYIRVSTEAQNTARQEEALADLKLDKTFIDKASGKDTDRPQLAAALAHLREGDTFIVYSMDRLSRSLNDLITSVKSLTSKGVKVQFIKESLTFTGDNNPMANLMLGIMGSLAEWERSVIRERQLQGITIAKAKGAYKGRKKALNEIEKNELRALASSGAAKAALARQFGISRQTLYSYLK
ncbi:recombinase family protein [Zwartia sp.]|uniref:recombinase family protein n=1 Tax=Zwartia sp. TaxID=2978004 RepID=UPI002728FF2A|nr:recombinase family protein [Zwartia sp.]MDO9025301.1 recombinase family protein [Zwartia sp.]